MMQSFNHKEKKKISLTCGRIVITITIFFAACFIISKPVTASQSLANNQLRASTGERILHFPQNHSIGELYIQDDNVDREFLGFRNVDQWKSFTQAKGDVTLPAGKILALYITQDYINNASALSNLLPDDLYMLAICGSHPDDSIQRPKPNDKCVPYITHLTKLKNLHLMNTNISTKGLGLFSNFTSLEYLTLSGEFIDEELKVVSQQLKTLKGLYIQRDNLTDKGLTYLSALTSLKELQIGGGRLTNDGIANLTKLPSLEYLSLYSHNFTDDCLVYLKDIPSLRILDAGASHIWTNAVLEHIAKNRNIEAINLCWSNLITDDGIAYLKNMPNLKRLAVGSAKLTDKAMNDLKEIPTLEYLSLSHQGITDSGIQQITGLQNLKFLSAGGASNSPLTDKSLSCIGKLQKLEELQIGGTGFSDEGMQDIAKLKNLKRLDIFTANQLTNKGLAELSALENLTYLYLGNGTQVSVSGLKSLNNLKRLKNLTLKDIHQDNTSTMDISGLTELENLTLSLYTRRDVKNDSFRNSQDWACLANLTKLDTLQISGMGIEDKGIQYLSNLKNLRFLNIYCAGESSITDDGIKQLSGLPKLYRLMIKDGHFTDKSLDYLSGMPALIWLELTSDFAFSNKTIDNFQKKNPKIEHLVLIP